MKKRWLIYCGIWAGCVAFFLCNLQWLSWVVLMAVTLLPVLSLLLSLPAMCTARLQASFPAAVPRGTPVPTALSVRCPLPLPQWRARLAVGRELTGEGWSLRPGQMFPTNHCGRLECSVYDCRIYDYLGLFSKKMKAPALFYLTVRPTPVPAARLESRPGAGIRWVPRRSGGYAENYELRLYRPGDSLQQIHWKLSGKTGKLLLREPQQPLSRPQLSLGLVGTPEQLDEKLGRLLHRGQMLLDDGIPFRLHADTGNGGFDRLVENEAAMWQALDALLAQRPLQREEEAYGEEA